MAIFAALIVVGDRVSNGLFALMMFVFLGAFIVFTILAEGAAVRAEQRVPDSEKRRVPAAPTGRSAPRGT